MCNGDSNPPPSDKWVSMLPNQSLGMLINLGLKKREKYLKLHFHEEQGLQDVQSSIVHC
jgi:hypothetical protein